MNRSEEAKGPENRHVLGFYPGPVDIRRAIVTATTVLFSGTDWILYLCNHGPVLQWLARHPPCRFAADTPGKLGVGGWRERGQTAVYGGISRYSGKSKKFLHHHQTEGSPIYGQAAEP